MVSIMQKQLIKERQAKNFGKITDSEGNVLSKEEAAELKADVEAYLR